MKYPNSELTLHTVWQLFVRQSSTHYLAWEEFPTGLRSSQTCSGLDLALSHPKLPLLTWEGSCLVESLLAEALPYWSLILGLMTTCPGKCSHLLEICLHTSVNNKVKFCSLLHIFQQKSHKFLQSLCANTTHDLALTNEAEKHYTFSNVGNIFVALKILINVPVVSN